MANGKTMGGEWKTKDGRTIPYGELELSHLQNIIRYVEKLSREGFTVRSGGGSTAEDMWYDEDVITGNEVLKIFDYVGLMEEMRCRTRSRATRQAVWNAALRHGSRSTTTNTGSMPLSCDECSAEMYPGQAYCWNCGTHYPDNGTRL